MSNVILDVTCDVDTTKLVQLKRNKWAKDHKSVKRVRGAMSERVEDVITRILCS